MFEFGDVSQLSVEIYVRAPVESQYFLFFGLGKKRFPEGDLSALTGTAGRQLVNMRRPRRAHLIEPRVLGCARFVDVKVASLWKCFLFSTL